MSMLPTGPMDPIFSQQINIPKAKPKGGMFGGGGWADAVQAALGGYLASMGNPVGMQALQNLHTQKLLKARSAQEDQQYQQRREDALSDYVEKQKIERQYGAPRYFESNSGDQYTIGPDGQPQLVFKDPLRYKFIPNGMGGVVPVDVEKLMSGQGGQVAPTGVTFTPIDEGGPAATPQAMFPRPY